MTTSPSPSLESLMHAHGPFLRRLARALVRDEHLAEELVQDTWLAAHAAPETLREPRAWLGTVLRRRAASARRRSSEVLSSEVLGSKDTGDALDAVAGRERLGASGSDVLAQLERERLLAAAVERLDEPYRTAVFLRYHEDLPPRRIAKVTAAPVKTVMTRIRRGLEKLKVDLDEKLGADDEGRSLWFSAIAPLGLEWRGSAMAAGTTVASSSAVVPVKALGAALLAVAALAVVVLRAPDGRSVPLLETPLQMTAEAGVGGEIGLGSVGAPSSRLAAEPVAVAVTTNATRQAETSTLGVRVLDAQGEPARAENVLFTFGGIAGDVSNVLLEASDSSGLATFQVPAGIQGMARHATSAGHVVIESTPAPGGDAEVTLQIAEQYRVDGRVLDHDGDPVPGAGVYVLLSGASQPHPTLAAASGPDGSYSFQCGSWHSLMAVHSALTPSDLVGLSGVPRENDRWSGVDLVLGESGNQLTGRVVDENGEPVAEAAVHAGSRSRRGTPFTVLSMTDEDGRFIYPAAIASGESLVTVTRAGLAPSVRKVNFSGAAVDLEIAMVSGTLVQGQVLNADGTPAVHAWIDHVEPGARTLDRRTTYSHWCRTDNTGHFELRNVPPGTHQLRAVSHRDEELGRASAVIDPTAETLEQNLQLSLMPMIAGRVVDAVGQPLVGLFMEAKPARGNPYPRKVLTDADGRFRITALPPLEEAYEPERLWTVSVVGTGQDPRPVLATRELVAPGTLDLDFEITFTAEPRAMIVGTVATSPDPGGLDTTLWLKPAGWAPGWDTREASVAFSDQGRAFEHGPVAPGTYYLELHRGGATIASRSGIEIGVDGVVDVGELQITPGAALEFSIAFDMPPGIPESLRGKLLDEQHIAIERGGRKVFLERTESGWRSEGHLEPGTWSVRIDHGERLILPATTVTLVEGEIAFVEGQGSVGATVPVRVLMPAVEAWSRASVRAYSTSGVLLSETRERKPGDLDEDQALSFRALANPGECDLALVIDGVEGAVRHRATVLSIFEPTGQVEIDSR